MLLMERSALGTFLLRVTERCAKHHTDRDPNPQPDRNMPCQDSCNRAERRSQRDA